MKKFISLCVIFPVLLIFCSALATVSIIGAIVYAVIILKILVTRYKV